MIFSTTAGQTCKIFDYKLKYDKQLGLNTPSRNQFIALQ
ncbi:hypothetical protein GLIP_0314 [Aliiglaciecola lipolytica E3]|uniref:Uncharacterized protein n=1 Tax=Aliiglaciecola lipolytica E3 TaxID=1127673 RepID=K6WWZ2_9ALTE|nr:hypothetical protein GLIP_0314 [Aliiglaciecola lipolytica E3]